MENNNQYYVYKHYNPETSICFYVGIGKGDRVFSGGYHRNKKWKAEVRNGNGFTFDYVKKNISKKEALDIERNLISKIGLENLCNIVGESGNSTAFKKGQIPWNKGLMNAQANATKKVEYNGVVFDSVQDLTKFLGIGTTTFYRRIKKGVLNIKYIGWSTQ